MQALPAFEVAFGLGGGLVGLFGLRTDLGELELGEQLALAHHVALANRETPDDAAGLERQPHLVLARDQSVGADRRTSRP